MSSELKTSNPPRATSRINSKLEKQLTAYIAAAGAAGVTLFAVQPADAKVVYTPANTTVGLLKSVPLDLNNDGTADFMILTRECGSHSICLIAEPAATGNGVRGQGSTVPAGFFGVPVGPGEKFLTGTYNVMAVSGGYGNYSFSGGPWASVTGRYLGLKFVISGETHYAWARLNVDMKNLTSGGVVITGYAYETAPNVNIIEGHQKGATTSLVAPERLLPPSPPATLGLLARGADALALWRRENTTTPL